MTLRSKIVLAVCFLLATAVLIPSVFAQDNVTVSTEGTVNVRTGPGLSYAVRGVLYESMIATGRNDFDTSRRCLGRNTDFDMWVRVDNNGIEGWVARCVVTVDGDLSSLPVASAGSPVLIGDLNPMTDDVLRTANSDPRPDGDYVVGFTRARVNVRSVPSLAGEVLAVTAPVEDFFVTGRTATGNWLQLTWGVDQTGWVAGYLMLMPSDWDETVPVK